MPQFFERLQSESRYYASGAPEFLRTHPVTRNRIADSRNRAEQYPVQKPRASFAYRLTKARLRVITSNDPEALLERIEEELEKGSFSSAQAARYGYALALLKAGHPRKAKREFNRLWQAEPERLNYILGLAESLTVLGEHRDAIDIYQKGLALYPGNNPLTVRLARLHLAAGNASTAADLLRDLTGNTKTPDPAVFELLALAETRSGHEIEAKIARAEYYRRTGRIAEAINQLEMANRQENIDFYQASRIDALLEELKQEHSRQRDQRQRKRLSSTRAQYPS